MTDNQIDISSVSDIKLGRYSSDNFKKSLGLAKKLSNPEPDKDAKYYFDLGVKKLGLENYHVKVDLERHGNFDEESVAEIIDYFDRAILINPLYLDAYIIRAKVKSCMGDKEDAIDDYTQAIEIDPTNSWTYYWRAFARKEGRDAIVDLDKSININPNHADAYSHRGWLKYRLGDYQGATDDRNQGLAVEINDYSQRIALNPNDSDAYFLRAKAKCSLGDYQGKIDDYHLGLTIAIDTNDSNAFLKRAEYKKDIGDYQGADDDYSQVILLNPNDHSVYKVRAEFRTDTGDYQGAITDCNQAIILFKIEKNDIFHLSEIYSIPQKILWIQKHIRNYQGIIDICTRIIALRLDVDICTKIIACGLDVDYFTGHPYCDRAEAKYRLGNYIGTIEDCNQSIKSESDVVRAYFFRASARNELGNYQEAIDDCDLAIYRHQNESEYVKSQYFKRLLSLRSKLVQ
jgi:tetratricopeptide (TPR) repeat protein